MPKPSSKKLPIGTPKAPPSVGVVLASKFRVERIIGRGGMGVVIEATNIQLDQKVALKLLHTGADDPNAVQRFSQEARAAARLKSEHVARVFDVGHDEAHGPYIVMEYLDGRTLAEVITATGRVPVHRAIEYVIDACEGLAEAHVRGIIHQDVKPANLFLVTGNDGRPSIKVLDFGIATMRSTSSADLVTDSSSSHRNAGTPAYLAPEQLRGTPKTDHRADVWALGCVLYELIVAERAFQSTRFTELVTQILESPHAPFPLDLNLDVPLPIKEAIDRCLERDREKRFMSTGELALALLPFARRRSHSAVARAVAHVKTGGLDPTLEMPSSMPPPPASSSGSLLADTLPSSSRLKPPTLPAFGVAGTTPAGMSTATDVSSSQDVAASSERPDLQETGGGRARTKRGRGLLVVGLFSLFLVTGSAVLAWTRFAPRASVSSQPIPTSSTMTNVSAAPTESAAPAATTADPSSSMPASVSSAVPSVVPSAKRPFGGFGPRPVRPPTPTVAPHPTSTSTEAEIRHTR